MKHDVPIDRESGIRLRDVDGAAEDLRAMARAVGAVAVGLEVGGRRARRRDVALRMTELAAETRAIADSIGARRPSTSERLRWEWLASTSTVIDGNAETRVADEAIRTLERVVDDASDELGVKLRRIVARCRGLRDEAIAHVA